MYISEIQMQEIIEIIKASIAKPDRWTIISTIISALTAIVAIIISICTAKKQNKIALYEKRLNCYLQFSELKSFVEFIKNEENLPQKAAEKSDTESLKISTLQNKYCRGHNLFVNQEFLRYRGDPIKRNIYVWDCVEKDQFMLTSLLFLSKSVDELYLSNVKTKLSVLIEELFRHPASDIDAAAIKRASTALIECFSKIEFVADNLKKLLRLEKV